MFSAGIFNFSRKNSSAKMRILLVDDHMILTDGVRSLLEGEGFEIFQAESAGWA